MTILAHLGLWALVTLAFAIWINDRKEKVSLVFAAAGLLALIVTGIPVCLVCVVRFWWG